MKSRIFSLLLPLLAGLLPAGNVTAQVPNLITQQGRVAVNGVNFDGTGQFKFALVDAGGSTTFWSNDGTTVSGLQPAAAVSLPVTKGLYSVLLGDTSLTNMAAIPPPALAGANVWLRVWFNDGVNGFQQLTPDQRIAPHTFLPDGVITAAKLAAGAVGSAQLAPGASAPAILVSANQATAVPNATYLANGSGPAGTTISLPAAANLGDQVTIHGLHSKWTARAFDPNAWTPRTGFPQDWRALASSVDGVKLVAAAFDGSIYTSANSGVSWIFRDLPGKWTAVTSSADGGRLAAVAGPGRIFTSTDSGATWTPREADRLWRGIASSADGTRLAAVAEGERIYISPDSGFTWTPRENNRAWQGIASSSDGTKLVAVANGSPVYVSADSGATWVPRETSRAWQAVTSSADGTKLAAVVNSGLIYTSSDSGATWTARNAFGNWRAVASSSDGNKLLAVANPAQLYVSGDTGITWNVRDSARKWSAGASSADGMKLVAAVTGGSIYTDAAGGFAGAYTITAGTGRHGTSATFRYLGPGNWTLMEDSTGWVEHEGNVYYAFGNVGVRTTFPRYGLSLGYEMEDTKLALFDDGFGQPYGLGVQAGQFRMHVDGPASRFSFLDAPGGNERMTVNGTGEVGIGTAAPRFQLSLGNQIANTKFALFDNGVNTYGLGIGAGQFRLHVDQPSGRFSFLDSPAGAELMTVKGTGQLGLGTANPQARMHILTGDNPAVLRLQSTGGPGFGRVEFLSNPQGDPAEWRPGYIQSTDAGGFTGGLSFVVNGTGAGNRFAEVEAMRLQNGGAGIGRAPVANRLEVEGDASKTTAGAWLANSDRRIKTDIRPVAAALELLGKVRPVTFRYTEEYRKAHPDIKDVPYYNVIAQEFREVFPNAVKSSGEKLPNGSEILQVDTYPAAITAIAAIKELKTQNEALQAQNGALSARLAALEKQREEDEKRFAALEKMAEQSLRPQRVSVDKRRAKAVIP